MVGTGAAHVAARRAADGIGYGTESGDCRRFARVEYSEGNPDSVRDAQPRGSGRAGRARDPTRQWTSRRRRLPDGGTKRAAPKNSGASGTVRKSLERYRARL